MRRLALALAAGLLASGCASATTVGSARVLEPGRMRTSLSVKAPFPVAEVEVRRGLVAGLEVGARVGAFGSRPLSTLSAAADVKIALREPPSPDARLAISVVPGFGYESVTFGGQRTHALHAPVAVLFGWRIGASQEVVVGPRLIPAVLWNRDSARVFTLLAGSSVGFLWRVHASVRIVPEASLFFTPTRLNGGASLGFQLALGALFGA